MFDLFDLVFKVTTLIPIVLIGYLMYVCDIYVLHNYGLNPAIAAGFLLLLAGSQILSMTYFVMAGIAEILAELFE
jgi:hypothetical protein